MADSFQKKESIKKNALRKKIKDQKNGLKKVYFLKGTKLSGILPSIKEITKARTKI